MVKMVDVVTTAGVGEHVVANRLFFLVFIVTLIWFIVTMLIMLVLAKKSHKRARILTVFVVSTIVLLVSFLLGYFQSEVVLGWLL
jgi:hypothetical protein